MSQSKKQKKLTGTVHYVDLEGGYFTLRTKNSDIFKLDGGGDDLRVAGTRAEVEGEVEDHGFGISFGTPVLKVFRYRIL